MVELPPLIPCARCLILLFFLMLPHCFTLHLVSRVVLSKHSQSLYGESFCFPSRAVVLGPNVLWSTLPQCQASLVSGRLVLVWEECCLHCTFMKTDKMHRPTHQSKVLGGVSFCHAAKFQYLNGSWFLIFLELYLSEASVLSLAWSPSSTESRLVDRVSSGLTSFHCFSSEWGVLSSLLLVGQSASNASSSCDTRVDSLPLASCTSFCLHSAPGYGWWVTGNFNVGYGCALPCLWDIPHTLVGLDRAVAPQQTPCSPTCSGFCVGPWRQ